MTLHFTLTENDYLALTERYVRDSKSHQASRTRGRWFSPCIFIIMACFFAWRDGSYFAAPVVFGGTAIVWWLCYPSTYDAYIRANAKKQMAEPSYDKIFGACELQLLDEHLHSTGPLGSSTYNWSSVDRVTFDTDYLFIFLSGSQGYSISIDQIGQDVAQRAYDLIQERIKCSR